MEPSTSEHSIFLLGLTHILLVSGVLQREEWTLMIPKTWWIIISSFQQESYPARWFTPDPRQLLINVCPSSRCSSQLLRPLSPLQINYKRLGNHSNLIWPRGPDPGLWPSCSVPLRGDRKCHSVSRCLTRVWHWRMKSLPTCGLIDSTHSPYCNCTEYNNLCTWPVTSWCCWLLGNWSQLLNSATHERSDAFTMKLLFRLNLQNVKCTEKNKQ